MSNHVLTFLLIDVLAIVFGLVGGLAGAWYAFESYSNRNGVDPLWPHALLDGCAMGLLLLGIDGLTIGLVPSDLRWLALLVGAGMAALAFNRLRTGDVG